MRLNTGVPFFNSPDPFSVQIPSETAGTLWQVQLEGCNLTVASWLPSAIWRSAGRT